MPYKVQKKDGKHCVVKEGGGQVACHDTRQQALAQMRALYANEKASLDVAANQFRVACAEGGCDRAFLDFDRMVDHAEAVHTFNDIQQILRDAVREMWGKRGEHNGTWVHVWVQDASTDWCVFEREEGDQVSLHKVSYSIVDNQVTFGTPVEVVRRTIYEPVTKEMH